eukprot:1095169-Prymnesium_polylepis.1
MAEPEVGERGVACIDTPGTVVSTLTPFGCVTAPLSSVFSTVEVRFTTASRSGVTKTWQGEEACRGTDEGQLMRDRGSCQDGADSKQSVKRCSCRIACERTRLRGCTHLDCLGSAITRVVDGGSRNSRPKLAGQQRRGQLCLTGLRARLVRLTRLTLLKTWLTAFLLTVHTLSIPASFSLSSGVSPP